MISAFFTENLLFHSCFARPRCNLLLISIKEINALKCCFQYTQPSLCVSVSLSLCLFIFQFLLPSLATCMLLHWTPHVISRDWLKCTLSLSLSLSLSIYLSLCFSTFHVHTSCECFPMFTLHWTNCLKSIFEISCLSYFCKPDVNRKS